MHFNTSYTIIHYKLDSEVGELPQLEDGEGYYLVFWWRSIPLGDLYIEPCNEKIKFDFKKKVIHSIKETIKKYNIKSNENWQEFILNGDFDSFNNWMTFNMGKILYDPPPSVPISVIICTRNRYEYLSKCIVQLQKLVSKPDEIIVIDNAPSDNLTENLVQSLQGIRYYKEEKVGLDNARNKGITVARNDLIAFIDDDAIPHPLWTFKLYQSFLDPDTTAITGLVFPTQLESKAQILFEKYWTFNRGYSHKFFNKSFIENNTSIGAPVWEIGAGVNMAFRKSVLEKIGYFHPLLDAGAAGCNGDSEVWFRLLANGYKIHYTPEAVVYHEHRKNLHDLEKQIYNYMKGNTVAALLQQKYHSTSNYRRMITKNLQNKTKNYIRSKLKRSFLSAKILKLEIAGIFAGISFYKKHLRQN